MKQKLVLEQNEERGHCLTWESSMYIELMAEMLSQKFPVLQSTRIMYHIHIAAVSSNKSMLSSLLSNLKV